MAEAFHKVELPKRLRPFFHGEVGSCILRVVDTDLWTPFDLHFRYFIYSELVRHLELRSWISDLGSEPTINYFPTVIRTPPAFCGLCGRLQNFTKSYTITQWIQGLQPCLAPPYRQCIDPKRLHEKHGDMIASFFFTTLKSIIHVLCVHQCGFPKAICYSFFSPGHFSRKHFLWVLEVSG